MADRIVRLLESLHDQQSASAPSSASSSSLASKRHWLLIDGMAELRAAFFEKAVSIGQCGAFVERGFLERIEQWRARVPLAVYLVVAFEDPAHLPMPRRDDLDADPNALEFLALAHQRSPHDMDSSHVPECMWPKDQRDVETFWATLPLQWRLRRVACEALSIHMARRDVPTGWCMVQALWMVGGDDSVGNGYRSLATAIDAEVRREFGRAPHLPLPPLGLRVSMDSWRFALREMILARRVIERTADVAFGGFGRNVERKSAAEAAATMTHAYVAMLHRVPKEERGRAAIVLHVVATGTPEATLAAMWARRQGVIPPVVVLRTGTPPLDIDRAFARLVHWTARLLRHQGDMHMHERAATTFFVLAVAQLGLPCCVRPPERETRGVLLAAAVSIFFRQLLLGEASERLHRLRSHLRRSSADEPSVLEEALAWLAYQAFSIDAARAFLGNLPRQSSETRAFLASRWRFFPSAEPDMSLPAPTSTSQACRARAYRTQWLLQYWSGRHSLTHSPTRAQYTTVKTGKSITLSTSQLLQREQCGEAPVSTWGWRTAPVPPSLDDWLSVRAVSTHVVRVTGVDLVYDHDDPRRKHAEGQ